MSLPPNARGVPLPLLSPPDTTDGVEMGRYLKRAACACASSTNLGPVIHSLCTVQSSPHHPCLQMLKSIGRTICTRIESLHVSALVRNLTVHAGYGILRVWMLLQPAPAWRLP